jgi:hypothetical protein
VRRKKATGRKRKFFYKEKIDTGRSDESMSIGPKNPDTSEVKGSFSSVVNPTHDCGPS